MPGPMHFDDRADVYEQARPPYPEALWRRLDELGALRPGSRALDLGAGTGQATTRLLAAGLQVVAVEPGPRLAARLRERCPGATVIEARAEEAPLGERTADVAVAATSIHWMDLDVLLPRLHRALVPGGWLLVWRNVFGDPDAPVTPFREEVARIVEERGDQPRRDDLESLEVTAEGLTRAGLFAVTDVSTFRWQLDLGPDAVRALFGTFSEWSEEEAAAAGAAVDALGGTVREHYLSWLIALRRTGRGPVR